MTENPIAGPNDVTVNVFVSYAREDSRWLDPASRHNLVPFLVDSLRRHKVVFWFDHELKPGDEFRQQIKSKIDQSQIALLIISQNFLNSAFIESEEMPRIAERALQG
ncbi:MAG TPA: toll/interleukin-1 receptor domain-containing protein, partial [Pirellulales bacterium]|nr:toll/interleukin-1 receptor domain-containing protein [Pirellulales bacterium]